MVSQLELLSPSLPFSLGLGRGQKVGVIELKVKSSNFKKCGIKSDFFFLFFFCFLVDCSVKMVKKYF